MLISLAVPSYSALLPIIELVSLAFRMVLNVCIILLSIVLFSMIVLLPIDTYGPILLLVKITFSPIKHGSIISDPLLTIESAINFSVEFARTRWFV